MTMLQATIALFAFAALSPLTQQRSVQRRALCYRADMRYMFLTIDNCPPAPYVTAGTAAFLDEVDKLGWAFLKIETNANLSNELQAYVAGVLEGNVTEPLITKHWKNTYASYCYEASEYCDRLHDFLYWNMVFLKLQSEYLKEPYSDQVSNMLTQLAGLEDGYFGTVSKPHRNVSTVGLLLLQMGGDLMDLERKFERPHHLKSIEFGCSAFVKPLPNSRDVLTSHVTWSSYDTMLRIQKLYNIPYSYDGVTIPGHTISMSSYPGVLLSIDDFYITSAELVITETTFSNNNPSTYKYIKDSTVPSWIRSMVANRLASTGEQWVDIFARSHSGTYTNQWMVVDYKAIPTDLAHGHYANVLYVLEEIPGTVIAMDMTDVLYNQQYWASYNIPYYPEIFNVTGQMKDVEKYGDWFTYEKNPRALIFKRDQGTVLDMRTLIKLMRYNNFEHDPLSRCNCTPPYSAENAISARNDLNSPYGKYPFKALGHRPHGGTDMKATNHELVNSLQFTAISGPTYDDLPPFQWSTSYWEGKLSHFGHPDVFKFPPVTFTWRYFK